MATRILTASNAQVPAVPGEDVSADPETKARSSDPFGGIKRVKDPRELLCRYAGP